MPAQPRYSAIETELNTRIDATMCRMMEARLQLQEAIEGSRAAISETRQLLARADYLLTRRL